MGGDFGVDQGRIRMVRKWCQISHFYWSGHRGRGGQDQLMMRYQRTLSDEEISQSGDLQTGNVA